MSNTDMALYLWQYNVLRVGSTRLGDPVHEGLGGEAGGFGGSQTLCHTVHIHILVEGFLHMQWMSESVNFCMQGQAKIERSRHVVD